MTAFKLSELVRREGPIGLVVLSMVVSVRTSKSKNTGDRVVVYQINSSDHVNHALLIWLSCMLFVHANYTSPLDPIFGTLGAADTMYGMDAIRRARPMVQEADGADLYLVGDHYRHIITKYTVNKILKGVAEHFTGQRLGYS